eukprot:Nitzschia sp. Nitz4//scaffold52_size167869//4218//6032//NITZ4_002253-RA/size167869-processed-gene-0.117-mRNA-1//1//CDS//3329553966//8153//frame0
MAPPPTKRPKTESTVNMEVAKKAWEHYRDYVDSLDNDPHGDTDELHEILAILEPLTLTWSADTSLASCTSVLDLLPILLSAVYYHLAETAIAEYLHADPAEQAKPVENSISYLQKALQVFPHNVAAWSMGANFGRMSQRLSPSKALHWYEAAVKSVPDFRTQALALLEADNTNDDSEGPTFFQEWVELLILNQILGVEYQVDEAVETTTEEDEISSEPEEGSYSASAVEATARFMCAMLASIQGNHDMALTHLKPFGVTHRLNPNVWTNPPPTVDTSAAATKAPAVFDNVLPEELKESLQTIFSPDAAFWTESDYANRGYYSFFMPNTQEKDTRSSVLEQVIMDHLLPRAQQLLDDKETICGVEWWAHTRPIHANLGHNLHFDTDEARLASDKEITHPVLSSVLYLTGGNDPANPAGVTVLLDQAPQAMENAQHAWLGTPKDNTYLLFPGNLLHGVLPCRPSGCEIQETADNLLEAWKEPPEQPDTHRLVILVGFWTRNVPDGMKERKLYGPCGPMPPATDEHTWVCELEKAYKTTEKVPPSTKDLQAYALPQVSPAWEEISTPAEDKDDEEADLEIPYSLDHRFFVKGAPKCYYDSLMEDKET